MTFRNNSKIVRGGGTYYDHLKPKDGTKRQCIYFRVCCIFVDTTISSWFFFFFLNQNDVDWAHTVTALEIFVDSYLVCWNQWQHGYTLVPPRKYISYEVYFLYWMTTKENPWCPYCFPLDLLGLFFYLNDTCESACIVGCWVFIIALFLLPTFSQ